MRCLNCGKEITNDAKQCPFCKHKISDEELELDLPELKSEEELEKTRAISKDEDDSLLDDIKREIEKEDTGESEITEKETTSILNTKESYKTRKAILGFCVLLTMSLIVVTTIILSVQRKKNSDIVAENYMISYEKALKTYYDTNDIDDVIVLLQKNKDNKKVLEEYQEKTRVTCDSWLLLYVSERVDNLKDFETVTKKYEDFLYGLNKFAVVKVENEEVKALTDSDYLELSNQLSNIYDDSIVFFDALKVYEEKDYNKAYYMFEMINSSNTYYDKAQSYLNNIEENVLYLLKSDIEKIEKGIDGLTKEEQIKRYTQIEQIIIGYKDVYLGLNLSLNKEYNKIVQEYRDKLKNISEDEINE